MTPIPLTTSHYFLWSFRSRPIQVEKGAARLIDAFVGVRAEVVALRLQEVGRQLRGTIAVVIGQSSHQCRSGNAGLGSEGNHHAPVGLTFVDVLLEVGIE